MAEDLIPVLVVASNFLTHLDGSLAGAGAGFEQQRGVEVAEDAGAGGLVGGRVMGWTYPVRAGR